MMQGKWLVIAGGVIAVVLLGGAYLRARKAPLPTSNTGSAQSRGIVNPEIQSAMDAVLRGRTWYVVDTKGDRIHLVDTTGAHRASFGRSGRGPGEFMRPTLIAAAGN